MAKKIEYRRLLPLMKYYRVFDNLEIKQNEVFEYDGTDVNIGWLISNVRRDYKEGKLTNNEIELLELMGIKWEPKVNFEEIKKNIDLWYRTYGNLDNLTVCSVLNVGEGKSQEKIPVGRSLISLRKLYRAGSLSNAEYMYMDMLGVPWAPKNTEVAFAAMIDYADKYGSIADVKLKDVYEYDGKMVKIGQQLNHLRVRYNKGLLDENEIGVFESIGIIWNGRERKINNNEEKCIGDD